MKPLIYALLGSFTLSAAADSIDGTIRIPVGQQEGTVQSAALPVRGMNRDRVLARYGRPGAQTVPVGDPPISRWHYDGFTVYFEGDVVLHSVVAHVPRHPLSPSPGP
ncbi:MAG: phosphodiesterase [Gammaproteobacteria bacterium]|nr:phosphodiesterase [Gammaproteobacteria bacterium]